MLAADPVDRDAESFKLAGLVHDADHRLGDTEAASQLSQAGGRGQGQDLGAGVPAGGHGVLPGDGNPVFPADHHGRDAAFAALGTDGPGVGAEDGRDLPDLREVTARQVAEGDGAVVDVWHGASRGSEDDLRRCPGRIPGWTYPREQVPASASPARSRLDRPFRGLAAGYLR